MFRHVVLRASAAISAALLVVTASSEIITDETPIPPPGAFGGPWRVLSPAEREQFLRGRMVFDRSFGETAGLGPDYNGDSCRGCHLDPVIGGSGPLDVNVFRAGFDNGGAGPFQNMPPGPIIQKLRRTDVALREDHDPACDVFEQRNSPSAIGLGRVETIPDAAILANEDPLDLNADGVTGVARRVTVNGIEEIGRFGWKAGVPTLADFARDALGNEVGITAHDDGRGFAFTADADPAPDPEIPLQDLEDLIFFMRILGPPPRGGSTDPAVAAGEALFTSVGCVKCHIPELPGSDGPVRAYSDFLLHEIAPAGFRGMSDPGAPSGSYRTPPLWGVSSTGPWFHDGGAETLEAAILRHFGEAESVRQNFEALSAADRAALLAFLNDL